MLARNQELQKALEEARKAREEAKAAEGQRLAALKAAEQATKAAEDAIAKKREHEKSGEAAKLAALPKVEAPRSIGSFDGTWTVSWTSVSGCLAQNGTFRLPIANGTLGGKAQGGTLAASGAANWIMPAVTDGAPIRYQGTFRGNTGAGTFTRSDNTCNGTFHRKAWLTRTRAEWKEAVWRRKRCASGDGHSGCCCRHPCGPIFDEQHSRRLLRQWPAAAY